MARAVVFVGPTLSGHAVLASRRFNWSGPATQGDIYRATRAGVAAIGLIDAQFETVPTVWHKEILWALSQGIHVFGAASMGALRAAELADFGMIGVGRIYEDFHRGVLEDDDEVAIVHAPRELGYRPLTEAMVDIRATLAVAEQANVVARHRARAIMRTAKAMFFKDRTWGRILTAGTDAPLRAWLADNKVEQKRMDAADLIDAMRIFLGRRPPPFKPSFTFQLTEDWIRAIDEVKRHRSSNPGCHVARK